MKKNDKNESSSKFPEKQSEGGEKKSINLIPQTIKLPQQPPPPPPPPPPPKKDK